MNFETIIIYGLVIANSVGLYLMQKYVRQAIKDLRNDADEDRTTNNMRLESFIRKSYETDKKVVGIAKDTTEKTVRHSQWIAGHEERLTTIEKRIAKH
jgi:hypothetical protein